MTNQELFSELISSFAVIIDEKLFSIKEDTKEIKYHVIVLEERMEHLEGRVDCLDERMDRLEEKMEHLEGRMDCLEEKMEHLEERVGHLEEGMQELNQRTESLEEGMQELNQRTESLEEGLGEMAQKVHFMKLQNENEVIPRLQNIEECYTSTFVRYKDDVVQIERLQTDVDVLKSVVSDHSLKLKNVL